MQTVKQIDKTFLSKRNLKKAHVFVLMGPDTDIAVTIAKMIRNYLHEINQTYQQVVIGVNDPATLLFQELENPMIFEDYRLILVYDGAILLQNMSSKNQKQNLANAISRMQSGILLFVVSGELKKEWHDIFSGGENCFLLQTKKLYDNQIWQNLQQTLRQFKIRLTDEAWRYLREIRDQKHSSHLELAQNIRKLFANRRDPIDRDELEVIFTPEHTMHVFTFMDHLFAGNVPVIYREIQKLDLRQNNFVLVTRLLLKRLNEIRWYDCASQMRYTEAETKKLLKIQHLPPFVQNKILQQLKIAVNRFPRAKQLQIYEKIIKMQIDFRSCVSINEQINYFRNEIVPMFV